MGTGAHSGWKWTETEHYAARCEHLSHTGNGSGPIDTDAVKWAIEDNVLLNPILASVPLRPQGHPDHNPDVRRVTVEEAPALGIHRPLVVVFQIEPPPSDPTQPREVTGIEIAYFVGA